MDPLTLGLSVGAPILGNMVGNLTRPRTTRYEREMKRLAGTFKENLNMPYAQTAEGSNLLALANEDTDREIANAESRNVAGGATDEAKLASRGSATRNLGNRKRGIMAGADMFRQRMLQNYMGAMGQAEQARQFNEQQWSNNIGTVTGALGQAGQAYMLSNIYNPGSTTNQATSPFNRSRMTD